MTSDYRAPIELPRALTSLKNWLVWRLIQKQGEKKPRKVPFYVGGSPRSGAQGGPEDRAALGTYEQALAVCKSGDFTGIGFALLPGDGLIALDFDHCIEGGVIDPRIERLVAGTYSEVSPSGTGIRAFMLGSLQSHKDNAGESDRNSDGSRKDGLFDLEVFGTNGFVTITGNPTPDCDLLGLTDTVCPVTPEVRTVYRQRFGSDGAVVVQDADDLMGLMPTLGWTLDQARAVLFGCDPSASREMWLNALMAIHHEMGGSPEALDLVDEWSAQADKYGGRRDVEARWWSFGRGSGAGLITGRWLMKWRSECATHEKYQAVDEWKKELSSATDEMYIREKICPQIRDDVRVDAMGRVALSKLLQSVLKRMGTEYPIANCKRLIMEKRPDKTGDSNTPRWLQNWVYVTDDDKFYRMDSDEWLSMQGFNAKYNRELPKDDDGKTVGTAVIVANEVVKIPTVTRAAYLPWAAEMFEANGVSCVNTYRPSSPPVATEYLSETGKKAVQVVTRHLRFIAGDRAEVVGTFLNWIAHNVQYPGKKIRWAPLLKGIEGDGKTVIGELLAMVMGRVNVRNVSPKVLGTDFTGWAEGAAAVVLEEIKLTGHNRYDILNALKPFVTNATIEVHRKGKDTHDAPNTINYLAFTNYVDALPLTDTDRRWWIVFTPWADKKELAAAIGPGLPNVVLGAYFNRLHETIATNAGELRRWLLDHPISEDFNPNGTAPMTDEKAIMIGMSKTEEESTVREILEKTAVGITPAVFASSYLKNEVMAENSDISLETSAWNRLLIKLGYTRIAKKLKWRGKTEIIWVFGHKAVEPWALRKALDATLLGTSEFSESDDLF